MRVFNFAAGPATLPAGSPRTGPRRADRLAAARACRSWRSATAARPSSPSRARGRGGPARAAGDARRTTRCCSCRAAPRAQFAAVPLNLAPPDATRRLRQHRRLVEEGDRRGAAPTRHVQRASPTRPPRATPRCRAPAELAARAAAPPTCTTRPTRPSAASSFPTCPTAAACRWWRTCPRRSCRGRIEVERFGLIYAGAQKNIGPAGLTRRHRARGPARPRARRDTPAVLDYQASRTRARCSTRRRPSPGTSPAWCSSGSRPGRPGARWPSATAPRRELLYRRHRRVRLLPQPGRARRAARG